jgi:hypothetical protein
MMQSKVVGLIATTIGRDSVFGGLVSTHWSGGAVSYVICDSCRLQFLKGCSVVTQSSASGTRGVLCLTGHLERNSIFHHNKNVNEEN